MSVSYPILGQQTLCNSPLCLLIVKPLCFQEIGEKNEQGEEGGATIGGLLDDISQVNFFSTLRPDTSLTVSVSVFDSLAMSLFCLCY